MRYLDLNVVTPDTASYRLKIYSLKGQLVFDETSIIPKGKHTKRFDLIGFSPEEYILRLSKNEKEFKPSKFILLGK